ncbi:MAG: hydroxymethylpyrimidine/phosphomethylpyrimidine kinase [Halieaceae bacterium]|nr:hydroxymethylpyrimidine/phosphomethylpyrimidine kinase [Halieaceae bacterium]
MTRSTPAVMCLAELDPTGAGGIAADIETLASLACHCTPIATAISIQDTQDIKDSALIDDLLLIEQMRAVLEDIEIDAIKLHQLASTAHIESVHTVLSDYPLRPLLLDPALWALPMEADFTAAICDLLLPMTTLAVLTEREAYALTGAADNCNACAQALLERGCEAVLISSEAGIYQNQVSQLFGRAGLQQSFEWQQLPDHFAGAGSTFGAAIVGYMAHGLPLQSAVRQAQEYTYKALVSPRRIGMGKLVPGRIRAKLI